MFLLDLLWGIEGGWGVIEIACAFLGDFCWEIKGKEWCDHQKKKFFINKSVKALIPLKEGYQGLLNLFQRGGKGGTSVHPLFLLEGGGVEPPTKFSRRGYFTGAQLLEVVCWERGGDFFQGGCNLHKKN